MSVMRHTYPSVNPNMYTTYTSSKSEETPIPVPKLPSMAYQRSISFNSVRCHDPERTSSETEAPRSLLCAYKPLHTPRNIVHATSSGIHGRTGIPSNSDSRCADDSQAWWFFLQLVCRFSSFHISHRYRIFI